MNIHIDASTEVDRCEYRTRALVEALRSGQLTPAGAPHGPEWTPEQQSLLFDSLETGWPVGLLVSWTPPRTGGSTSPPRRDGHRPQGDTGVPRRLQSQPPE